ncbi:MAG: hypothetical protein ABIH52_01305 [Candidatus Aenigmatarchaeota archaeon]
MRKSQVLIFEQVLMFTIGVTIFIIYFATFSIYQDYYLTTGTNDQLTEVKSFLTSHVIKMAMMNESNITTLVNIPRNIGNQIYKIEFSNTGINITTLEIYSSKTSSFLNLNKTMSFNGRVVSGSGKLTLIKRGNEIRIF